MLSVVKAPSFIFKKKQQPNNFLDSYKVLKTMGVFHLSPLDFGLEPWHNERLCSSPIANVMGLHYVRICSTSSTWKGYAYPLTFWARLFIRSSKYFLGREWHLLHWKLVSFNLIECFWFLFHWQRWVFPKRRAGRRNLPWMFASMNQGNEKICTPAES